MTRLVLPLCLLALALFTQVRAGPKECREPETDPTGMKYLGTQDRTKSGRKCQAWKSTSPHKHNPSPSRFAAFGYVLDEMKNYCRNVGSQSYGPWCYTTDPDVRYEACDIPMCEPKECIDTENDPTGKRYLGTMAKTKSGKTCQPWKSTSPHRHNVSPSRFAAFGYVLDEMKNYCRNVGSQTYGPWCYTTDPDVRYEACSIQNCAPPPPKECIDRKTDPLGMKYHGTMSMTKSGINCQPWMWKFPHDFDRSPARFADGGFKLTEMGRYCRNVGRKSTGPWCYTLDSRVRTEPCDIPSC